MRERLACLVPVLGLLLCVACEKDDPGPRSPDVSTNDMQPVDGGRGGGGVPPVGSGGGGDGDGDEPDDAGTEPTPDVLPSQCAMFDAVSFLGEDTRPGEFFNAITNPTDFAATRAELTWEGGCAAPQIRLTLSDGRCPAGDGHQLVFYFPVDSIESGALVLGQNQILPEPAGNGLRIRYTRPNDLEPDGEWGTCAEASGILDLIGELGTSEGSELEGRFNLDLTRCDTGFANVQTVSGTFGVTIENGLEDICPDAG